MTDPYIQINGTKIELFDNDLSAVRTPKQLSDGTYATPSSGWIEISESWVYYSATTVSGATGVEDGIYSKSDKIRYKQGGAYKYSYVTGNSGSACFLIGDAVANAAITNIAYSHIENPLGFPHWFNVTAPTFDVSTYDDSAGLQPVTTRNKIKISGNKCEVQYIGTGVKAGASANINFNPSVYPGFLNISADSLIGSSGIGTTVWMPGIVRYSSSTVVAVSNTSSIADNEVIAPLTFIMTYEI